MQRVPPTQMDPLFSGSFAGRDAGASLGPFLSVDARQPLAIMTFTGTAAYLVVDEWADRRPASGGYGAAGTPLGNCIEFDDDWALSGSTWRYSSMTATSRMDINRTWPHWLHFRTTTDQGNVTLRWSNMPPGNFSLTWKCSIFPQANYAGVYLFVYDADESDGLRFAYDWSNGLSLDISTKTGGGWSYNTRQYRVDRVGRLDIIYLHVERNANNWFFRASANGMSWFRCGAAVSKALTNDHAFLQFSFSGQAYPCTAGFDWIRDNWLWMPA